VLTVLLQKLVVEASRGHEFRERIRRKEHLPKKGKESRDRIFPGEIRLSGDRRPEFSKRKRFEILVCLLSLKKEEDGGE